jgi:hypothetical protein
MFSHWPWGETGGGNIGLSTRGGHLARALLVVARNNGVGASVGNPHRGRLGDPRRLRHHAVRDAYWRLRGVVNLSVALHDVCCGHRGVRTGRVSPATGRQDAKAVRADTNAHACTTKGTNVDGAVASAGATARPQGEPRRTKVTIGPLGTTNR